MTASLGEELVIDCRLVDNIDLFFNKSTTHLKARRACPAMNVCIVIQITGFAIEALESFSTVDVKS